MPFGNAPDDEDDENGENGGGIRDEITDDNGDIDEEKVEELIEKLDRLLTQQEEAPDVEFDISSELQGIISGLEVRQLGVEERMAELEEQMEIFQGNLERLLFGPEGAPSPLEETKPEGDLWDVGDRKHTAESEDEYKIYRTRAATDTDNVSPNFHPDYVGMKSNEAKMLTYFELYREGYASLKEIYEVKLNAREWEMFVRELVEYYGYTREMVESDVEDVQPESGIFLPFVDVINPDPSYFGFFTHGDELSIDEDSCPIPLLEAYDDYYFADTVYDSVIDESRPVATNPFWESLDMDEPDEYEVVQGMPYGAFNSNMVLLMQTKDKYDIPDWMRSDDDVPGSGGFYRE